MAVDNLIIERFVEQINRQIDAYDQLGELDRAFALSKCVKVINVLTARLNEFSIPIPVSLIQSIYEEKR